jgi:hypothetical protein
MGKIARIFWCKNKNKKQDASGDHSEMGKGGTIWKFSLVF